MTTYVEDFEGTATGRKAARLCAEDRVQRVEADVYFIRGDSDSYLVVLVGDDLAHCPCKSARPDCSHVRAARHQRRIDRNPIDDPFEGLL